MKLGIIASSKAKYRPETNAYYAAVKFNGGQLTGAQLLAVDNFIGDLKTKNLWNDLDFYFPIIGANGGTGYAGDTSYSIMMAHKVNLKRDLLNPTAYTYDLNYNLITPTQRAGHFSTYWVGGYGYSLVNYNLSTLRQADLSIGISAYWTVYSDSYDMIYPNQGSVNNAFAIGNVASVIGSQGPYVVMYANNSSSKVVTAVGNRLPLNQNGFLYGSRVSLSDLRLYRNGVLSGTPNTNTTTSSTPTSGQQLRFPTQLSLPQQYKSAWAAKGWNATKMADMYSAETAFNTALGR